MQIVTNPTTAWCAGCLQNWRPDMIAIQMPLTGTVVYPIFCYECVTQAAAIGAQEEQRRRKATLHGGNFS